MNDRTLVALHTRISGRVQGVFFRDTTRRRATSLGLGGWVKNLPDGCVEAVFVGPRAACELALEFVRMGPPRAHVTDVVYQWAAPPKDAPVIFEVRG